MRVTHMWGADPCRVEFVLVPEPDLGDRTFVRYQRTQLQLTRRSFAVLMPNSIPRFEAIHPDVWGLIVVLALFPFVGSRLQLSFAVTEMFASICALSGRAVQPTDAQLVRRGACADDSAPAAAASAVNVTQSVAYNGRAHAAICAATMGTERTVLCYVDHWDTAARVMRKSDNVYASLDYMMQRGFDAKIIKTDVQTLVEPPAFGALLGPCIGCALLSDALHIGTVALGSRLIDLQSFGSALRVVSFKNGDLRADADAEARDGSAATGACCYEDCVTFWRELFHAVGLTLQVPTCGLPDTLAMLMLKRNHLLEYVTLCGSPEARLDYACGACADCLYYGTIVGNIDRATSVDRVWRRAHDQHPQALASVADLTVASPWHLFWLAMVTREELAPREMRALLRFRRALCERRHQWHPDGAAVGAPTQIEHLRATIGRLMQSVRASA